VIDAAQGLGDRRGVGHHADRPLDLGQVPAWDYVRRLVVDSALESRRAPVDELNRPLRLDRRDGGVDVLGDDVPAVHEAAGHVLSVAGIALGHHVGRLEDRVGNLRDGQRFVERLRGRDDGSVRRQHEVNARVRDEVRLELGHVDVERAVEAERRGEGRNDLSDQAVQVGVRRALDVEVAAADVVQGLVVQAEGTVRVLQKRVRRQDGVVRFDDGGRNLRGRRNGEGELALAPVVDRKALQEEAPEPGPGTSPRRVEDEESLQPGAVIRELADAVQNEVDDLLPGRVVSASVVIGRV